MQVANGRYLVALNNDTEVAAKCLAALVDAADRIAYAAMENGQFNIYVFSVDGQQLVQMPQDAGNNESPSWSPDGSLIAFSSTREGASRIYLMTAYGTDQRRLLTLAGEQTGPAWSPSIMDN